MKKTAYTVEDTILSKSYVVPTIEAIAGLTQTNVGKAYYALSKEKLLVHRYKISKIDSSEYCDNVIVKELSNELS